MRGGIGQYRFLDTFWVIFALFFALPQRKLFLDWGDNGVSDGELTVRFFLILNIMLWYRIWD
jgi:hypothetical protein